MNPILSRALWSALPLLGLATGMRQGLVWATAGLGIFLAAVLIFLALHPFVPARVHHLLFCLMLLALGVSVLHFLIPAPGIFSFFLPASLCVLAPPELFRKQKKALKIFEKNFLAGAVFWGLMAAQGILSEWGGAALPIFSTPAGSYLLLGLAATLLPGKVRK